MGLLMVLFWTLRTSEALCLFEKHYNVILNSTLIKGAKSFKGGFQCEKLCIERPLDCDGANVLYIQGAGYICEMLKPLPYLISSDSLVAHKGGKFIHRKGKHYVHAVRSWRQICG